MARKKSVPAQTKPSTSDLHVMGLRSEVLEQPITDTLKQNYMPYAIYHVPDEAVDGRPHQVS